MVFIPKGGPGLHHLPLIRRLVIILLCSIAAAVLLLTAVFCLPNDALQENATLSLYYIRSVEGIYYPNYFHSNPQPLTIDNYTNNLMVETCLADESESALHNALYVRDYARYWHGYLLFLRPLLCLGSIELVRYIHMILLMLLFCSVFYETARKIDFFAALAFAVSLLAVWFFLVPMSLQYAAVFYLTFLFMLLILHYGERLSQEKLILLFFLVGILTSFFDLLTVPLLTLGLPLIALLGLRLFHELPAGKSALGSTLQLSVFWALGYGLFWASKWLIGGLVLKADVLSDAVSAALMRLNVPEYTDPGKHFDRLPVILKNIKSLFPSFPFSFLAFAGAALGVAAAFGAGFLLARRGHETKRTPFRDLFPLALVTLYPFLWYCVLTNHSGIHAFFTCKLLSITIFGGLMLLLCFLKGRWPKKQ